MKVDEVRRLMVAAADGLRVNREQALQINAYDRSTHAAMAYAEAVLRMVAVYVSDEPAGGEA